MKDQIYFGHGALIEFGYAHNYFADIQSPYGNDLYVLTPVGSSGNYFVTSTPDSVPRSVSGGWLFTDDAFSGNAPDQSRRGCRSPQLLGQFQPDRLRANRIVREPCSSKTAFVGSGVFQIPDTELSGYVVDNWRLSKRLQLDLGIREDRDQRIEASGFSPRVAFSWAPFASGRTRVAGGYAITYDAVNLGILGRSMDQSALTTQYNANGSVAGSTAITTFALSGRQLRLPKAENWTASVDHRISRICSPARATCGVI